MKNNYVYSCLYIFPYLISNQLLFFSHDTLNLHMTLGFEQFLSPFRFFVASVSDRFRELIVGECNVFKKKLYYG